jgi:hypothetical protein
MALWVEVMVAPLGRRTEMRWSGVTGVALRYGPDIMRKCPVQPVSAITDLVEGELMGGEEAAKVSNAALIDFTSKDL